MHVCVEWVRVQAYEKGTEGVRGEGGGGGREF